MKLKTASDLLAYELSTTMMTVATKKERQKDRQINTGDNGDAAGYRSRWDQDEDQQLINDANANYLSKKSEIDG